MPLQRILKVLKYIFARSKDLQQDLSPKSLGDVHDNLTSSCKITLGVICQHRGPPDSNLTLPGHPSIRSARPPAGLQSACPVFHLALKLADISQLS